jgi:ABC-type bacteriocin/lantibiotic exporter with double-glycine peptidase domain
MKAFILLCLVTLIACRTYPLYKQCDSRWGNQALGTSSKTICQAGCLMSSAAMALSGVGSSYNPETLNKWLISNGGYASGNMFVWASINRIGLHFDGFVANSQIKSKLDAGKVVICNVHNGGHWVLATGYSGNDIKVNDPGYSTTSYSLSQIV